MTTPDWTKKVVALIKWGKCEHLEKLVQGKLYLNTPEYYRINADKSFGDKFESCAYSYRQERDQFAPVLFKNGVLLSQVHPTSATIYSATDRSFYLHCWSIVSAWDDFRRHERMLADLKKQQEQLGPCFVALRSGNIGKLLKRIQRMEPMLTALMLSTPTIRIARAAFASALSSHGRGSLDSSSVSVLRNTQMPGASSLVTFRIYFSSMRRSTRETKSPMWFRS